uniref:Retrotransposon gag domain-containing protein n=1 Tax=Brassica oleracea var. oleracea TaxID=109376 RepID=A0A0D2ZVX7_BRAOL
MQSMVERLSGVAPPIWKSNPYSYADTPFTDEITMIEMPRKFSFPSIKAYDGTTDLDDHVAQYRLRMLAVAIPKGSREATMCKGFGSTLTGPALQWYINLPSRSIASFAVLSDKFGEQFTSSRDLEKTSDSLYEILHHRAEPLRGYIASFNQEKVAIAECSIPTAISAFKRGQLPDGDLHKELTKYQCKTMEDEESNLNYVIRAVDEQDELPEATQREAELQRQIDGLQSHVTELHKTWEETNPELSSEFQRLKEKLNEHSKQLEQSAEKLSQLESENLTLRDENQALNAVSNKKRRFQTKIYDVEESESEPEPDKEAPDGAVRAESPMITHLHQMFSERLNAMQSMVERLSGVAPPIWKSNPYSYADTPFTDEITMIEMPRKFSFPSIKAYDGTTDLDDHVAQYRLRMLAVAIPKGSREATMCKGFGSTLTGPALQWYINLPSRSIASFAVLSDKFGEQFTSSRDLEKTSDSLYEILNHRAEPLRGYIASFNQEKVAIAECSIPTAISAFKRRQLPDGDLHKELTKYQCKTMEDVLSRAWAHVKWEEDVASRAKEQRKQDPKTIRPDRTERDEKPSQRPARDSGNQNRGRYQNRSIEKAEGMAVS